MVTSSLLVWAYLDPGTGSLLLQILIAGFLSSLFYFKSTIAALKGYVGRGLARHE